MQANQTQVLSFQMNLPMAFVVDTGSVILSLQSPNGTNMGQVAGSVSPNTSQSVQTLSAIYTPQMAGLWKAQWQAKINGQLFQYPFYFWVVWTDVYDAVRTMLGASTANIPDQILDREFRNIDTALRDYAPTLAAYSSFNNLSNSSGLVYSDGYDQGMAKLLAARVRRYVSGKRPTGEVSLFKKGTTTVQYTEGSPRSEWTLEQEWEMQGMALLEANIPEIYATAVADRNGDEIMSRGVLAWNNRHPFAGQMQLQPVGVNVPTWWANNRLDYAGGDFE